MTEFLTCNIISSTTPSSSQNDDDNGGSGTSGNHHHHHHHPKTRREPIEVKDDDDWNELVDPELKDVLRSVSLPQYNKIWWQHVLNGIMHIPYPLPSHIQTRRLDGIIEDDDDNYGKKRNAGRLFWNKNSNNNNEGSASAAATSAIMWIHGGGRIIGSATGANDIMICTKLVEMFDDDVPVLSVNYRTSLSTAPFPAALNDVTNSYKSFVEYLLLKQQQQQKTILGSESEHQQLKIIVAGESAGGGLAAELCQRLLDESTSSSSSTLPLPVAQLLIYPMLDDRTGINNYNNINNNNDDSKEQQQKSQKPPNLVWSGENNQYAWDRYLGRQQKEKKNDDDDDDNTTPPPTPPPEPPKYAAAARRTNLVGLPPAWIMVGSLDLFREECYDYAYRLAHDGHVTSRYVEVVGGFHAMFGMGRDTDLVGRSWQDMYDFGSQYI